MTGVYTIIYIGIRIVFFRIFKCDQFERERERGRRERDRRDVNMTPSKDAIPI
jgi:hypothetical protein